MSRNTGVRIIQKKIRRVVKDLLKKDEMRTILADAIDIIPAMNFLLNDTSIDEYGEDIVSLRNDADICFKHFSKLRGRKRESLELSNYFHEQLQLEFPEVFSTLTTTNEVSHIHQEDNLTGKRTRGSIDIKLDDILDKKKSSRPSYNEIPKSELISLNINEKNDLKYILNKLSKYPDAEYFLFPVDSKLYPEYYELIKNPKDLYTIKSQLLADQYTSILSVLSDIRLIWENCRSFNVEGSDILLSADNSASYLEELVEEKLGIEFVQKKKNKRKEKSVLKAEVPDTLDMEVLITEPVDTKKDKRKRAEIQQSNDFNISLVPDNILWPGSEPRMLTNLPENFSLTKSSMRSIIKEVASSTYAEPFLLPVDFNEAPGYKEMIKQPMDLTSMKKRVISGLYDNNTDVFISDMRLVWENCVLYNDSSSQIAEWAMCVGECFEKQLQLILEDEEDEAKEQLKKKSKAVDIDHLDDKKALSISVRKMKKILKEIYNNELSVPFHYPVDLNSVPGYTEIISTPMDLSTIKARITTYDESPGKFLRDMRLIFDNCQKFNIEDSDLYKAATALRYLTELKYNEAFPYVDPTSTLVAPTNKPKAGRPKKSDVGLKILDISGDTTWGNISIDDSKDLGISHTEIRKIGRPRKNDITPGENEENSPSEPPVRKVGRPRKSDTSVGEDEASPNKVSTLGYHRKGDVSPLDIDGHSSQNEVRKVGRPRKNDGNPDPSGEATHSSSKNDLTDSSVNLFVLPTVSQLPVVTANKSQRPEPLRYPQTFAETQALITSMESLSADSVDYNEYVREKCNMEATELLNKTKLPFIVAPELYVIKKFGELIPLELNCYNANYLFPVGYSCSRTLRLCVVPTDRDPSELHDSTQSNIIPFVNVDVKSSVLIDPENNKEVSFSVTLENGTSISIAKTPKDAWLQIFGKELNVLKIIGGKLKRCKAVFNRLCVSPDALPFLEQVPPSGAVGADYYKVITAPMWLREVHSRLVDGTYDVEFDFAWDIRLIFKNCSEYNSPDSELYLAAQRLGDLFESLFVNWVLNVQDYSINDLAKGPWDKWYNLKYFDSLDPTENVCVMTGSKDLASKMLQCRFCEDQNLASIHPNVLSSNDWVCARCNEILEETEGNIRNNPFTAITNIKPSRYNCEEHGGNTFYPVKELGVGWCQAKRRRFKNLFLSPLGYEVYSKEEVAAQIAYEAEINQNLYKARALEFQENLKSTSSRKDRKKTTRHKRKPTIVDAIASSNRSSTADFGVLEDEGRLCMGKLHNFILPDGYKLAWFVCADESSVLANYALKDNNDFELFKMRKELLPEMIPSTGYFGFEIVPIKQRIEGLDHSTKCKSYSFMKSRNKHEEILAELKVNVQRFELITLGEKQMHKLLLKERWKFQNELIHPSVPASYYENVNADLPRKYGFHPLFPENISSNQGEVLLCLWEFLYQNTLTSQQVDTISFYDLICSVQPSGEALSNYGTVVFDEVCTSLVDAMYSQISKQFRQISNLDTNWHKIMMTRPLNIITWPHLALEALRILNFPLSASELPFVLEQPITGSKAAQRDLLCLVFNHPLIDVFLMLIPEEDKICLGLNNAAESFKRIKLYFSSPSVYRLDSSDKLDENAIYSDINTFSTALAKIFQDIVMIDGLDENRLLFASAILKWLNNLYLRWGLPSIDLSIIPDQINFDRLEFIELNMKRFWGGHILSNSILAEEDVLLPNNFNKQSHKSQYSLKMDRLLVLEKVMILLSKSDPDTWSIADRVDAYSVFFDQCMSSVDFSSLQLSKYEYNMKKVLSTSDIPSAPSSGFSIPVVDIRKYGIQTATCYLTGLTIDNKITSVDWVLVPPEYLQETNHIATEAKETSAISSSSSSTMNRVTRFHDNKTSLGPIALQVVVSKLMAARELSHISEKRFEERVLGYLKSTLQDDAKTNTINNLVHGRIIQDPQYSVSIRSEPLGYDQYGCSYWILSVQEYSTLFPFGSLGQVSFRNGCNIAPTPMQMVEPCILMREPNGRWGFHNGIDYTNLFDNLSDNIRCEKLLKLKLIEKIAFTRCILARGTLHVNLLQREWYEKRLRCELWLSYQKQIPENLSLFQKNLFVEVVWARYVELRQCVHFAGMYRYEEDPPIQSTLRAEREGVQRKQKKLRDLSIDDSFDVHPAKGWRRTDVLAPIRLLSASCTATRLLVDPSIYSVFQQYMRRCSASQGGILERNSSLALTNVPKPICDETQEQLLQQNTEDTTITNDYDTVAIQPCESEHVVIESDAMIVNDSYDAAIETKETDIMNVVENELSKSEIKVTQTSSVPMDIVPEEITEKQTDSDNVIDVNLNFREISSTSMNVKEQNVAIADMPITKPLTVPTIHADISSSTALSNVNKQNIPEFVNNGIIDSNGLAILPDLRALIAEESEGKQYPPHFRCKAVELLHLITGELLQIFPAGKDAANFFEVSQSGISLCLHDLKPDYHGYRWRNYDGPILNFSYISKFQLPPPAILAMQITRQQKNMLNYDLVAERRRVANVLKELNWTPGGSGMTMNMLMPPTQIYNDTVETTLYQSNSTYSFDMKTSQTKSNQVISSSINEYNYNTVNSQAVDLITSSEILNAKFLRLKGELLNIFYLLPDKLLRLPDLDEVGEQAITKAGEEAAANIRQGVAKISASVAIPSVPTVEKNDDDDNMEGQIKEICKDVVGTTGPLTAMTNIDLSDANVERLADKAARKAKRRMRRKLSMDKFVKSVQDAVTAQQLLDITLVLEQGVPAQCTYKCIKTSLPTCTDTLSSVAIRIFTLDRMITYEDLKGIDTAWQTCPVKPRTQFYPRCMQTSTCKNFICHNSKCMHIWDASSRIPYITVEGIQNKPSSYIRPPYQSITSSFDSTRGRYVNQQYVPIRVKDEDLPLSDVLKKLLIVKKELDIENIQPYVPVFGKDIGATEWL